MTINFPVYLFIFFINFCELSSFIAHPDLLEKNSLTVQRVLQSFPEPDRTDRPKQFALWFGLSCWISCARLKIIRRIISWGIIRDGCRNPGKSEPQPHSESSHKFIILTRIFTDYGIPFAIFDTKFGTTNRGVELVAVVVVVEEEALEGQK